MLRKLYHGSRHIIKKPLFGYGKNIMITASASTAQKTSTWRRNGQPVLIKTVKRQRGDLYITQIMDEEMKSDDARLR